ncbi:hypothetical protein HHK36_002632 [Tetracentron sinense]|uniref:Phosphoribosyltransferase C-terminal domain-containing protein n=1 Tax=Tetracentron sinense TaxID=13715 RepID=A0A834ZR51_TETSI|nr:hypothetical protein HHK36_002632 [Tetracentron sinense]
MHKKNCRQFTHYLKLIGNLLEQLKILELDKYSKTKEPLEQLKDALRRYAITKAFCIAFVMTFFSVFDVPVFWPILLFYWLVLFILTMKRQILHMIRYKYVPFSLGKQDPSDDAWEQKLPENLISTLVTIFSEFPCKTNKGLSTRKLYALDMAGYNHGFKFPVFAKSIGHWQNGYSASHVDADSADQEGWI